MGGFSWLYGHLPNPRQKKPQPSFETMIKMLQQSTPNYASASSRSPEISVVGNDANKTGNSTEHARLSPRSLKSGEYDADSNVDSDHFERGNLRRSLSLSCDLDHQNRRICDDDRTDDCIDQTLSFKGFDDYNASKSHDQRSPQSLSPRCSSDWVKCESTFSFSDAKYLEKEVQEDCHDSFCAPPESPRMSKSYSMPNFGNTSPTSTQLSPNTTTLDIKEGDIPSPDDRVFDTNELNNKDTLSPSEKIHGDNATFDNYDCFEYGCSSKEWIVPEPDDLDVMKHRLDESSLNEWSQSPRQDSMIKRIEDWVIDLQHCTPVEEIDEIASSNNQVNTAASVLDGLNKAEMKLNPSTEAAKRYISSLNTGATTVQLANHGLVAIPLLGAFVSLKVLNLSGNSIVRITAGSLPRGLHMLNLSKNKISTIEGLRELTRLRVLDLSYNKISRIGHGLASCSSVKELYLVGNKISEVEGLHRLLKLAVLDLRFNKIATSKSLGQLAANYNSLQALSLEGNPAQKNVGDEQLKKFLQSLLPNLAYYNRQHTKISTLKDSSDRAVRLGISSHGVRSSDHKSSSRSSVVKRASHSSSHGQKVHGSDSVKQSRGKHGVVPPSGSRTSHHHNVLDGGSRLQSLRSGLSVHKSQSAGNLAEN